MTGNRLCKNDYKYLWAISKPYYTWGIRIIIKQMGGSYDNLNGSIWLVYIGKITKAKQTVPVMLQIADRFISK